MFEERNNDQANAWVSYSHLCFSVPHKRFYTALLLLRLLGTDFWVVSGMGSKHFLSKTTTGSSQSRTPIVPLLFSPPPTFQGCLLPQTKTSDLQYTSSKKAPSHHSFFSILVFFLFGSLRLWEEASSFTSSITGTEPLY